MAWAARVSLEDRKGTRMNTVAEGKVSRPIHHHLYVQVLAAIALGVLIGHFFPATGASLKPLGDMFIAAIKMVIGPIIFCTVVHGIAGMQDMKKVGRVGLKALVYFELMTTLALVIGLAVVNVWQPGVGMNVDARTIDTRSIQSFVTQAGKMSAWDYVAHIIPTTVVSAFAEGDVIQVLFFALLFAFSLQFMGERGKPVAQFIDGVMEAFFGVVRFIMRAAPIGAFGAMAFTIGRYGLGTLVQLGQLMASVYITCLLFIFVALGGVAALCGFNILKFIRYIKEELLIGTRHLVLGIGPAADDGAHGATWLPPVDRRAGDPHRVLVQPRRHLHLPDDGGDLPGAGDQHRADDLAPGHRAGGAAADVERRGWGDRQRLHRAGGDAVVRRAHSRRGDRTDPGRRSLHVGGARAHQPDRQWCGDGGGGALGGRTGRCPHACGTQRPGAGGAARGAPGAGLNGLCGPASCRGQSLATRRPRAHFSSMIRQPTPKPDILARRDVIVAALRALLPADAVIAEPLRLKPYETDGLAAYRQPPLVVVLPDTTEQVAAVMRFCQSEGVRVVPRGAGTSLSGGALPMADAVVVGLMRMNRILDIDYTDRCATVQAGVTNIGITNAVQERGFFYAPDPSSQLACMIGGNVNMNSGGAHCLKYGVTANNLLGLKLVTVAGEILSIGGAHLDAAGYDWLGLLTGSEGQLAIITEVTVRILRSPEGARAMLAGFRSNEVAGACVDAIISSGIIPVALEFMDRPAIHACEEFAHAGYPLDAEAMLIIEVEGSEAEQDDLLARIRAICERHDPISLKVSQSAEELLAIWKGRKGAFGAIGRISPDYLCMDGMIPTSRLPDVMRRMREMSDAYGLKVANIFHAGDGNLHPLIMFDANDPESFRKAEEFGADILKLCVEVGGCLTGEHGVGVEKRELMPVQFAAHELEQQRRMKEAFDPGWLLNANKVFPLVERPAHAG